MCNSVVKKNLCVWLIYSQIQPSYIPSPLPALKKKKIIFENYYWFGEKEVHTKFLSFFFFYFLFFNIDLMDFLREIPGRQPLKLRAEASNLWSSYSYILLCELFPSIIIYSFLLIPKPFDQVASMASTLRQQRTAVDKRILKISELGVSVWYCN